MPKLTTIKKALAARRVALLGVALVSAVLLFHQRFALTIAVGDSMQPTLRSGQLLLVDKKAYQQAQPQRNDLVMAHYNGEFILKRIVGLPGEEVEVRKGTLYVNRAAQIENHATEPGSLDVGRGRLFDGDFATLGDNRAVPSVLAIHPIVSEHDIVGKVVRIW